jgi:hypothetical protein
VRWYRIKTDHNGKPIGFDLLDRLDQKKVSLFGDKKSVNVFQRNSMHSCPSGVLKESGR